MKINRVGFTLLLLSATFLLPACAHKTSVIARRNAAYTPTLADPIAVMNRATRTASEDELGAAVIAELKRRNVRVVPADEAKFTLGYWIEESWEGKAVQPDLTRRHAIRTNQRLQQHDMYGYGLARRGGYSQHYYDSYSSATLPDARQATQGIRLRLFVTNAEQSNRLQTAWEGYVAGGKKLPADKYDSLLRTLLDYFGEDFQGDVEPR